MSNLAWIVLTYSWSVLWLCCYVKVESRYVICHLYVSWVWYVIWPSWWASGQSILYALRLFWCVMHTLDNIIMAILVCFSTVLICHMTSCCVLWPCWCVLTLPWYAVWPPWYVLWLTWCVVTQSWYIMVILVYPGTVLHVLCPSCCVLPVTCYNVWPFW